MRTHTIESGSASLNVIDQGAGDPVILLHSLTFHSGIWDAQAEALAEHHRVLRVDLRGHGGTRWPAPHDITLEDMADDVAIVMDVLDLPPAVVGGLSLGGMVALRVAARRPERVRGLALLSTSAEVEPAALREFYHRVNVNSRGKPSDESTVALILALMFSTVFRETAPETVGRWRDLLMDPPDPEGVYFAGEAVFARGDVLDAARGLDIPALVMLAAADAAFPAEKGEALAAALPQARLVRLDGCGHMSSIEQPDAVTVALAELASR
jgi:3-oxoadipate enol-lactonase